MRPAIDSNRRNIAIQVHAVDAAGQVLIRRQLKRRYMLAFFQRLPPCLVGIEACASSHYWSRVPGAWPHRSADAACLARATHRPRTTSGSYRQPIGEADDIDSLRAMKASGMSIRNI